MARKQLQFEAAFESEFGSRSFFDYKTAEGIITYYVEIPIGNLFERRLTDILDQLPLRTTADMNAKCMVKVPVKDKTKFEQLYQEQFNSQPLFIYALDGLLTYYIELDAADLIILKLKTPYQYRETVINPK